MSHSVLGQGGRTVVVEAAVQVFAPSSASLIFLLRSYSVRSLPSRLFLYKYSRRRRAFRRIMLRLAPAVQTRKRTAKLCIALICASATLLFRRGVFDKESSHCVLSGQPSIGACHQHVHINRSVVRNSCIRCVFFLASMASANFLSV